MNAFIISHTDADGKYSAAIMIEALRQLYPDDFSYKLKLINYDTYLKDIDGLDAYNVDLVSFTDYSFSNDDNILYLRYLIKSGKKVIWIDHHETSINTISAFRGTIPEAYADNFTSIIDTSYCAAYLTYKYWYMLINSSEWNDDYAPNLIKYIDSWDTFKHNMPKTDEFHYGNENRGLKVNEIFSHIARRNKYNIFNMDEGLKKKMDGYVNGCINDGKVIMHYQNNENAKMMKSFSFECTIDDILSQREYKCLAINKMGNSLIFGDAFNDYDIVITMMYNGSVWSYSFYTADDDVNCAKIAEFIGKACHTSGGGHIKAAGCSSKENLFVKDGILTLFDSYFKHYPKVRVENQDSYGDD